MIWDIALYLYCSSKIIYFHTSMYLYDFFYHLHTKSSVATKSSIVSKNAFHVDITFAQIFDF